MDMQTSPFVYTRTGRQFNYRRHEGLIPSRTIRVPYFAQELHLWGIQRVVFGKLELRRKDAAFEGSALGTLNQRLPDEKVVLVDRPRCDAIRWVGQ